MKVLEIEDHGYQLSDDDWASYGEYDKEDMAKQLDVRHEDIVSLSKEGTQRVPLGDTTHEFSEKYIEMTVLDLQQEEKKYLYSQFFKCVFKRSPCRPTPAELTALLNR